MGQDLSSAPEGNIPQDVEVINPNLSARQTQRVRKKIQAFRAHAGTHDVCSQLLGSWESEGDRIRETWKKLSDPARRALIMNARERVINRARMLYSLVACSKKKNAQAKSRLVRRLMEKVAYELYDTSIVYGDDSLPDFIPQVLEKHGGGDQIPFGLLFEVNRAFEHECRKWSLSQADSENISDLIETKTSEVQSQHDNSGSDSDESSTISRSPASSISSTGGSSPVLVNSRSVNSLQGYYSHSASQREKRKSPSYSIRSLLSFVPRGLDPVTRKALTLEFLLEMRNAFLVHFAILVFSELFDESTEVIYKYEYNSDSDTDIDGNETDYDEEEEEDDRSIYSL